MGKKRRPGLDKDVTEARANCRILELGAGQPAVAGTARYKRGCSTTVDLKMAGNFYTPGEIFSKIMREALEKASQINPVRLYPERIGELAILADPQANLRSIAAILIKKYHLVCPAMGILYAALRKRELTEDECQEVVRQASWLGPEQKEQALAGWVQCLLNGGEDVRTGRREDDESEDRDGCD